MLAQLLRRVTRHYPLYAPRYAILSRLPSAPPAPHGFPIKNGLVIRNYYPGNDYVSKNLFWFGEFEPWVLQALEALSVPGGRALDIGANVGLMSLWLGRAIGPAGQVMSFEPNPPTYQKLVDNVKGNPGIAPIETFQLALSDSNGNVKLNVPVDQPGHAGIGAKDWAENRADVIVETRTLDDLLGADHRRFCVCKMDVEGHEESVLAGMKAVLARKQVDAFVVERHLALGQEDDALRTLRAAGYRVLRIYKHARTISLAPATATGVRGGSTDDFIAVLPGSGAETRIQRFLGMP